MSDHWLSKNQYAKIRYRAKKMGAESINLNAIWHTVYFKYTFVSFMFKPLQCHVHIRNGNIYTGHFSDKAGADAIKNDMDTALEFVDFLKKFNETIT